ncbi:hypothetical protein F751_0980 [Auxenochlorella protothecoides]|uniref:Uncharacterized protein n=1 Tax=Auxenochlorella protothecoides TaxID=3075 RepID=A0A087SRW0_AUXPR|nr:hypothetical protein F751_0980 [Auxenochlorella protothecoides]KFM28464.1 hypothetical protein F751_0980 [Auxenochlorella protothecoides]RMZ53894.1 hypothetical protein APUTEX25_005576 [Auxenochlorella protothecoides]|eukprot:RMZ53894.1 hypothetical protein APUTEX25_005576 [Auxenochlorella protothecoides]
MKTLSPWRASLVPEAVWFLRTGRFASVVALAATLLLPFLHSPLWVRHRSARGGLAMLFNTISYAFFL